MSRSRAKELETLYVEGTKEDCWLWHGTRGSKGYGRYSAGAVDLRAHVAVYQKYFGKVPLGKILHHKCEIILCVNPHHMELLTNAEHAMISKSVGRINSEKTHCLNGHIFSHKNSQGRRVCRICLNNNAKIKRIIKNLSNI